MNASEIKPGMEAQLKDGTEGTVKIVDGDTIVLIIQTGFTRIGAGFSRGMGSGDNYEARTEERFVDAGDIVELWVSSSWKQLWRPAPLGRCLSRE